MRRLVCLDLVRDCYVCSFRRLAVFVGILALGIITTVWSLNEDPPATRSPTTAEAVNAGTATLAAGIPMKPILEAPPSSAQAAQGPEVGSGATGGCAPGYGRGKQCLPVVSTKQAEHARLGHLDVKVPWDCAQVRELFPNSIAVNTIKDGATVVDPLHLDSNKDLIACGKGDKND